MVAELTFSSDPRLAKVLRTVVHFLAQQVGFDEMDTMNLMLAADEATSNIIRHGYGGAKDRLIGVRVESFSDRIEIVFEDTGRPVPGARLQPRVVEPSPEDVKPGGLGTHFITAIMDQVRYESEPGGRNRLYLAKYLVKEPKP